MFSVWQWSRFLEDHDQFLDILYGRKPVPDCPEVDSPLIQSISRGLKAAALLFGQKAQEAEAILADDSAVAVSGLEKLARQWLITETDSPEQAYETLLQWSQSSSSTHNWTTFRPKSITEQRDQRACEFWLPALRYYVASQLDAWHDVIKEQAQQDFDQARKNGIHEGLLSQIRFAYRFNEARLERPLEQLVTLSNDWYAVASRHPHFKMGVSYILELSLLLEQEGRLHDALLWIERGLELYPLLFEFLLSRARMQKKLGLVDESLKTCDQLIDDYEDDFAGYCLRSNIYFLTGFYDQARRDADKAIQLAPESPESYMARAFVNLQLSQYQQALDDFGQVLLRDPQRYDALRGQGKCLSMLGRDYDALVSFNQLRRQYPDDPDLYYELADVLFAAGYLEDCERVCKTCLALDPGYVSVIVILGMIALRRNDDELAKNLLRRAVELEPDNPFALNELSYLLYLEGEDDEAIALVDRAIDESPDYADALCNKGVILYFRSEFDAAAEVFEEAVKLMPDHVPAWVGKGNTLSQQFEFDEALLCYDKALRIDPRNADACHGKAQLYKMMGLEDEGRKWQERAVHFDPSIEDFS